MRIERHGESVASAEVDPEIGVGAVLDGLHDARNERAERVQAGTRATSATKPPSGSDQRSIADWSLAPQPRFVATYSAAARHAARSPRAKRQAGATRPLLPPVRVWQRPNAGFICEGPGKSEHTELT